MNRPKLESNNTTEGGGQIIDNEITLLLKIWPVLIVLGGLICAAAVGLYRIKENEGYLVRIEARMKEFMTTENHTKDCKIAALEIKDYFRTALAEFSAKLLLKMDEQQQPVVEAIKKNADMISRLDRRTRHLKDVDS